MPSPAFIALHRDVQDRLIKIVKPKLDAIASFTKGLVRSVPTGAYYTYPDASLTTDLIIFWALFSDVVEICNLKNDDSAIRKDPRLFTVIDTIFKEGGEYWASPAKAVGSLKRVTWKTPMKMPLKDIMRTLRNGNAHVNWCYENLSAVDYWQVQGWDTSKALSGFGLANRPKNNYCGYIADAHPFKRKKFWHLKDLRIVVAPYGTLRYHLHLFLNLLLNDDTTNVFNHLR